MAGWGKRSATVALQSGKAPLASPTFTGTPRAPTPAPEDDSTKIATTEFVTAAVAAGGGGGGGYVSPLWGHLA